MIKEIILSKINLIGYNSLSEDKLYHFIENLKPFFINELNQLSNPTSLKRELKINKLIKNEDDEVIILIDYQHILALKEARDVLNSVISFTYLIKELIQTIDTLIPDKYKIIVLSRMYQDVASHPTTVYKFRTPDSILYMANTVYQIIDNNISIIKKNKN